MVNLFVARLVTGRISSPLKRLRNGHPGSRIRLLALDLRRRYLLFDFKKEFEKKKCIYILLEKNTVLAD